MMKSFDDFEMRAETRTSLKELGFVNPSPIQEQTLGHLLAANLDFIGQAATGTGKTAAFGIPLMEWLDDGLKAPQALILCPTRELATQVGAQMEHFAKHRGMRTTVIYGGTAYDPQIRSLKQGPVIVVGTPGRILDHLERGVLQLTQIRTVVLDEADEMISMGFKEDLEKILDFVPKGQARTWLFSATMGPDVRQVASRYLTDPVHVAVNKKEILSGSVEQVYYIVQESNKPEVLCKVIDAAEAFYGIIFCQTKALVVDLVKYIQSRGYKVDSLHGDMNQSAREKAIQAFRDRQTEILVCTDVASRGLDVKDVTHVVNYTIPREMDVYVHRIGRTARSGKSGIAVSLVSPSHRRMIPRIEHATKSRMTEGKIPGRRAVAMKKVAESLTSFMNQKWHTRALEALPEEWKTTLEGMSKEEIAARFLAMRHEALFSDEPRASATANVGERPRLLGERPRRDDGDDDGYRRGPRRDRGTDDGPRDRGGFRGNRGGPGPFRGRRPERGSFRRPPRDMQH